MLLHEEFNHFLPPNRGITYNYLNDRKDVETVQNIFSQVSICAGCNVVYPWAAFIIGLIAGIVYMIWSYLIERVKIDDPLDSVAGEFCFNKSVISKVSVKYMDISMHRFIFLSFFSGFTLIIMQQVLYSIQRPQKILSNLVNDKFDCKISILCCNRCCTK